MAPSLGICKFCEKEQAKYKCPNCAAPYCGLVCYKPHKAKHDEEKESQSAAADVSSVAAAAAAPHKSLSSDSQVADSSMDISTTSATTASVPQPLSDPSSKSASSSSDFETLLSNVPLIHAMQNNQNLKDRLLDIYNCTQKAAFEAENARLVAQNAQFTRRGRGRGGRRNFFRQPQDWTVERGVNRGLRKIQAMRKGGKDENVDIEEWSRAVLAILEGDS